MVIPKLSLCYERLNRSKRPGQGVPDLRPVVHDGAMRLVPAFAAARGMYYGWWVVVACAAIILIAGGPFFYGFGVLVNPLREEFGWSAVTVAAAFSLRSEVSAFGAPLVGFLVDRLGPRKMMAVGVTGVALGFLALSAVGDILTFYAAITAIALTTNLCTTQTGSVLVARWFQRQRSRALTLMAIGGGLSGVSVPLLAWAVATLGWRGALVGLAVTTFATCVPFLLIIRESPAPGQEPGDGESIARRGPSEPEARAFTFGQAMRSRSFWLMSTAYGAANFGGGAVFSLLVPGLQAGGISQEASALAAAGIPILSLVGRLGIGMLGDTHDKRRLLALSFGLQAVALALLAVPLSEPLLAVFVVLFAIGFGGPIPLRTAIQADYFGVSALGRIQGSLLFISSIGGLVGPVVVGSLVDLTGGYGLGFAIAAAVASCGVVAALAVPRLADASG